MKLVSVGAEIKNDQGNNLKKNVSKMNFFFIVPE